MVVVFDAARATNLKREGRWSDGKENRKMGKQGRLKGSTTRAGCVAATAVTVATSIDTAGIVEICLYHGHSTLAL